MRRSHFPLAHRIKSLRHFHNNSSNFTLLSKPLQPLVQDKDPTAFANALTVSSNLKSHFLGTQLHAQIIKTGLSNNIFTQNNLTIMYSKCGVLDSGLKVFEEMPERNIFSWTSMISGSVQNGELEMGMEIYTDMIRCGCRPNEFALGSVLTACANMENIGFGLSVHCFALKIGIESNCFVGSSILNMYAKCGEVEAAEIVFECLDDRDVVCWNAMIGCYSSNGYGYQALELLSLMYRRGMGIDQFTFMNCIKGCSNLGDANYGKQIHAMVVHSDVAFGSSGINSLIDMYFKGGRRDYGLKVFSTMQDKDVISFNTVFAEFAQDGNADYALKLFSDMLKTGPKPNHVTFSNLFRLCGVFQDLSLGFQLHSLAYRFGFLREPVAANSLIDMFFRCGLYNVARSIFDSVLAKGTTTWNEMISGYNLNGYTKETLELFCNLLKLGVEANEFTFSGVLGACSGTAHVAIGRQIHGRIVRSGFGSYGYVCTSLINAYARFELLRDSLQIFNQIEKLDQASWGAMISALVHGGHGIEALQLLNRLTEVGERPDEFILGSILNGCANLTAYHQTQCIHSNVIKTGFEKHVYVASAVIDAYAKCGDTQSSRMAFDRSSRNDDAILFNTMIMAYANHGLVVQALEIFDKMRLVNLQPSQVTFVSIISLCSHLGLVELGCRFFDSINLDYAMTPSPENFGCLIDLFSRNGFLEEAKHVLETMPFMPWPAVWRSFLSGCRIHGNREMGEWAFKQVLKLVPQNDAAYVLLLKVYSEEGSWEDVEKVGRLMKDRCVRKCPGYSWIGI